jgi:2-methylcitrate dehydratase PrpD
MDATGPFNSISGTLMSIPFCIATTLAHGTPTMQHMTIYDDPVVNGLVHRISLITDPDVPVLSTIIEAETDDGQLHIREQHMTTADYAYDRAGVSALVRRIGGEQRVPAAAFDRLEAFVDCLPNASIDEVLASFAMLMSQRAAA